MSDPLYSATPSAASRALSEGLRRALEPAVARTVLTTAILVGIAGDALLGDLPVGVAFGCWIALVALNCLALASRAERPPSLEFRLWLATAVVFAFGLALRDAGDLQVMDVAATLGALTLAAVCLHDPRQGTRAARLRETMQGALRVWAGAVVGALPLVFREAKAPRTRVGTTARLMAWVRTAAFVVFTVLLFGALLRGADPVFARLSQFPSVDFSAAFKHVFVAGVFAWLVAGSARAALLERRATADDFLPVPSLGSTDSKAVLIGLNLLFATFVATQIVALVGGEAFVRRTAGLTLADYARHGFFQILVVAALIVPVLIVTRIDVEPGSSAARWHTRLSLPIIALIVGMIASAVWRFAIYVRFFGWSTERVYALVFMGWLAVVLVWLALTVLRDWPRPFFVGAAVTALATLAAVNLANIDARIAHANVARAASGRPPELDVEYLASMSAAAVPIAVDAVLDPRQASLPKDRLCAASSRLLNHWGSASPERARWSSSRPWRFWNADASAALRSLSANEPRLVALRTATCPPPKAPPQR